MTARPSLLFVSPVVPASSGNGLAMRAHLVLAALAGRCDVSLLVAARYPSPFGGDAHAAAVRTGAREAVAVAPGDGDAARAAFGGRRFDIVHAFRLASLPTADAVVEGTDSGARRWLDLDEVESSVQRRLAALHRVRGEDESARVAEDEADRLVALELAAVARSDRVLVASVSEEARLPGAAGKTVVLPNALPVMPDRLPECAPAEVGVPARFGFVGTLGYLPNADAVSWFAAGILPRLTARAGRPVELLVAGSGASAEVTALEGSPGVRLLGPVDDVSEVYRAADAVVVPLRAGGGTRIKVLEAFAFGRPVVTTALGVEGLPVLDRVHALVVRDGAPGEMATAFAEYCAELAGEPALGRRLAGAGRSLLLRRCGSDAVQGAVDGLLEEEVSLLPPRSSRR